MTPSRRDAWLAAACVVAIGAFVFVQREYFGRAFASPEALRATIRSFGALGPLVTIGLTALQVVVAPIPGQIFGIANGFLYGAPLGLAFSMIGLTLGSAGAMWIGRRLGREIVCRFVSERTLEKLDALPERRGELVFLLLFLLPLVPDDVACFAIGLTSLSIPRMLVISFVGRLPGMIAACVLGARADGLSVATQVAIAVGFAIVGVVLIGRGDAIESKILGWIGKRTQRDERAG